MATPHAPGCLIIVSGPQAGTFAPIGASGNPVIVGREPGSGTGIQLLDPAASRRHLAARFDPDTDRFLVADLGSANGTFLNGRALAGPPPADPSAAALDAQGTEPTLSESTLTEDDELRAGDTTIMLSLAIPADRASALAVVRKITEGGKSTIVRKPDRHH